MTKEIEMYLSRLVLDPRARVVQRDLADRYELHRTVMSGFGDPLPDDERVLFRVEQPRGDDLLLLVQSQHAPDWSALPDGYLCAPDPFSLPENPAVKRFVLPLQAGQTLRFRLRANVTVKRDGKRHGLYREEDQRAWLARKGQQGGFRPTDVWIGREGSLGGWRKTDDKAQRLTLFVVQFDGLLRVENAEALREQTAQGIGPAKAFGCGLLSLAPA